MVVQEIQTVQEYERIVEHSGNIVIVDFYATWCGPCKAIGPIFTSLSEHPKFLGNIVFARINVENVRSVASKVRVTSMPTFVVFVKGKEAERMSGAHRQQLELLIEKYAKTASPINKKDSDEVKGFYQLNSLIDQRQLDCLNMDKNYPFRSIFEKEGHLQSDVDEQLLLYIPFKSTVRIHSLILECKNQAQAPLCVSLYINLISLPSFEDVSGSGSQPTQRIENITYDANGRSVIPLRYVKFQRVVSLVLFVESNGGNEDVSRIDNLMVIGETTEEAANNGIVQKMEE
ncbi:thioredoxin [Pneumocystis jirovecii RU7]|uniref:Thioredoxin n=1 Tax=Pneumocystis jirovecii (strain RU7) TaxID=1408657 RepID=A0A0W4ZWK5_PNEJ7|nr:thioredoxin [Pneumocystis jirovecii RU7]KTW32740.1 thioredoxin [Pneumocystis jirovecii RU7]